MTSQQKPNQKTQNNLYTYQGKPSRSSSTAKDDLKRDYQGHEAKPTKREIPVK